MQMGKTKNSSLQYQYKGDGEYTPGDFNSIEEEVYEETLKLWDNSQESGQPFTQNNSFHIYLKIMKVQLNKKKGIN